MKRFLSILVAFCLVVSITVGFSASASVGEDGFEIKESNEEPYKIILEITDNEGNVIDPIPTYTYPDDLETTVYFKLTVDGLQEGDVASVYLSVSEHVDRRHPFTGEFVTYSYIGSRPVFRTDGSHDAIRNITASNNEIIIGVKLKDTFIRAAGKYWFHYCESSVINGTTKTKYTYNFGDGCWLTLAKAKVKGELAKEIKPTKDSKVDQLNLEGLVGSDVYKVFGKDTVMLTDIQIEGIDSDAMVKSVYLTQLSDEQRVIRLIKLVYDPLVMAKEGSKTTIVTFTIRSTNVGDIPCTITVTYKDSTATTTTNADVLFPRVALVMAGAASLAKNIPR